MTSRDDGVKQRCCEMKYVQCVTDETQTQCTVPLLVCLILGLSMAAIDGLRFLRSAYSSSSDLLSVHSPSCSSPPWLPLLSSSLSPLFYASSLTSCCRLVGGWGRDSSHTLTHTHARSPLLTHRHTRWSTPTRRCIIHHRSSTLTSQCVYDYSRLPWRAKRPPPNWSQACVLAPSVSGDFSPCLSLVHAYLHQRCALLDQATL